MKVICPKCQFENQADSSRVVCARCATIVEVRMDQGAGFDSNGKRQTGRLPFASNNSSNNSQPLSNQPFSQNKDVYATRIGDDFNDVLDVPDAQANYSTTVEAVPMFEDVFTTPGQEQAPVYDFASYEKTATTPIDSFRTSSTRQRETQDYTEPSEQEFMGWPVLPENSAEEEEAVASNRGGLFTRIGLIVGVFGVLCFLAYYFLGDFIAKRKGQEANIANAKNGDPATNPGAPLLSSSPIPPTNAANTVGGNQNPVVTPKPQDSAAQQNPKTKSDSKQVVPIPPVTDAKKDDIAGRFGPSKTTPPPSTPNKGNLTVQVGSFKDQGEANDRAARLKSAGGVDARVVKVDIPGKGTWYRVQVGGFASREEAASYGNQLRSKGVAADFIVTSK